MLKYFALASDMSSVIEGIKFSDVLKASDSNIWMFLLGLAISLLICYIGI